MSIRKYTIRLFPTPKQEAMFWQYAGARRFVWNWGLATIKQWYENEEKLDWNRLKRELTVLKRVDGNEWMPMLNAHTFRSPIEDLKQAMQHFFRRVKKGETPGHPRFKSRSDTKQGFWIPDSARVSENHRLCVFRQQIKMARPIPVKGKVGESVRIKHVAGRWYASFTVNTPDVQVEPVEPTNLVGLDIGLRKYAVISDGTIIENPRWLKQDARKLRHWQRKLARQKKGSARRTTTKKRIAKLHAAIANRRQHYSHLISKQIADRYDAVCIESHSLQSQMQGKFAKSVGDAGHGHFRQCLEYKLPDRGKQLVKVDPYYPSSKLCSVCGTKNNDLKHEEKWICGECGAAHDRDFNAAINLQHEGMKQVKANKL
jgi:putative transposase